MKLSPALFAPVVLLTALTLAACGPSQDHGHDHDDDGGHSHGDTGATLPPAEDATQAFFGDEAPVVIEALPEEDHDHGHSHDHGDGSEPHVH